jgi:hypothetical protein
VEKKIFKKRFIVVVCLSLLVVPCAQAEFMQKPFKANLTVSEGVMYNTNPGYADEIGREHDWANVLGATLSIELPFGEIHKYTLNTNTSWVRYYSLHKFNQINNNISHSVDLTFNRWVLNIHQNFDATSEPTTRETVIPSGNTLLRKRVNVPGFAIRGDLGKLKLSGGFDYEDYVANDEYNMLSRTSYTPYIEAAMEITPLLDGFSRYTYDRTIRKKTILNNSHSNEVQAGLRGDLTRYLTGEISAGYAWVDFTQTGNIQDDSEYHGVVYGGSLTNRLSKLTTQKLTFSLTPEQGYGVGNYYKSYTTQYTIDHTLNAKVDVNASAAYTYDKESGTSYAKEKAQIWQYAGGLKYHLAKNSDISLAYVYADKSSNRHGKDYKQQGVTTSIDYKF